MTKNNDIKYQNRFGKPTALLKIDLRKKYRGRCAKCGTEEWQCDRTLHIHRIEQNGIYSTENCVLLCQKCHTPGIHKPSSAPREELELYYRSIPISDAMTENFSYGLLNIFVHEGDAVLYRPEWNKITASTTSTILLHQIVYWWGKMGRKPFFKFSAPCNHSMYKSGDSWQEELGLTRVEFETARARIGARVSKDKSKLELMESNLVIYWRDSNNVTWYELNETLLLRRLSSIYSECRNPAFANVGIQHSRMHESSIPLTETTTKNTTETLYTDDDLDNFEEEELSDNSHELSPAIAEQKILFSLGEKKNGNDAKLNTQSVTKNTPPKSNKSGELSPTTPGGILLFAKLSNEAHAKGRKSPKSFASIAQRDAFLEVEERLTINQLEQAIDNALRNEITARRNIINYLSKYKARSVHAPALGYKHTTIVNEDGSVYF